MFDAVSSSEEFLFGVSFVQDLFFSFVTELLEFSGEEAWGTRDGGLGLGVEWGRDSAEALQGSEGSQHEIL